MAEEEKYEKEDTEEYDNQEVIVNNTDLRVKVIESDDRKQSIMECIGHLKSDFIYDTNEYRKSVAGTGTVFHVGNDGATFVVSCAHNVRTLVWHCSKCNKYMNDKAIHDPCSDTFVLNLQRKIIKANRIKFVKRCIHKKYEKVIDDSKKEIIEYGDTENVYECDIANIFINEEKYKQFPTGSSGYDLCVIRFKNKTKDYKNLVKNIRIQNGKQIIEEMREFNIWGFPGDKLKIVDDKQEQQGLFGMKSHENGQYSFPVHKKTNKMYFKQNTVDAYAGQSGSAIWVKKKETYMVFATQQVNIVCGVHTGGNAKYKHNVGTLFDDNILKQIDNFINDKSFWFPDEINVNHIGVHHVVNKNVITHSGVHWKASTSFFSNIVNDGSHHWQFKIKSKKCKGIVLGIWKVNDKPPTEDMFWWNDNGYGYRVGVGKTHQDKNYGIVCTQGDLVDMYLDFNSLTLKYSVNNKK
eukprot:494636_1